MHEPVDTSEREAAPSADAPAWAYSRWRRALVSAFLVYHLAAIIAQLLPVAGLAARVRDTILGPARGAAYVHATWNVQTWRMFAPNPHRTNVHIRVFVIDAEGRRWNMRHDVRTRRRFPYLFYDRMGKLNRRLSQDEHLHPIYAAWVCRDWELSRLRGLHERPSAARVEFVRVTNRIPPPATSISTTGYHPRQLRLRHKALTEFDCRDLPHGQVPNLLRARHGLPRRGPDQPKFHDVRVETWWTRGRRRAAMRERDDQPTPAELMTSGATPSAIQAHGEDEL
jgi:hypothetical protein